jgi:hypothetical protein
MARTEQNELRESKYEKGTYFLGSETWQVRFYLLKWRVIGARAICGPVVDFEHQLLASRQERALRA